MHHFESNPYTDPTDKHLPQWTSTKTCVRAPFNKHCQIWTFKTMSKKIIKIWAAFKRKALIWQQFLHRYHNCQIFFLELHFYLPALVVCSKIRHDDVSVKCFIIRMQNRVWINAKSPYGSPFLCVVVLLQKITVRPLASLFIRVLMLHQHHLHTWAQSTSMRLIWGPSFSGLNHHYRLWNQTIQRDDDPIK